MEMILRVVFYILIIIFLADIKVEGAQIPSGQGGLQSVRVHATGGQRVLPSGSGHIGGVSKSYRVRKPGRESFMGTSGKRIKKDRSHGHKFQRVFQQRKKRGNRYKVSSEQKGIVKVITKKVGSAPLVDHYIKRMGVVSIIDRMVPSQKKRLISHGQMVAGLMVYLLNNGRAIYEVEKWAEETAILSYLFPGYQSSDWTDDRIEDTLDAVYAAEPEQIEGAISAHNVSEFGIGLDVIHYDTTSVSLWGTYDSATEQPAVLITFGHNKDHRPDLKQVVVGAAVSGDGGVPLISNTHDGNTNDSVLPISYWERLRRLAGKSSFCFIGDCKIASLDTLRSICSQDGLFLAPMAMTQAEQERLIKRKKEGTLNLESVDLSAEKELRPIYERLTDRVSNRRKKENVQQKPDSYMVHEDCWLIKDNLDRPHKLRKLIVYSEQLALINAETRKRHLEKAQTELSALRQKLNKRKLVSREAIETAKNKILSSCKVPGFMDAIIEEHTETVPKKIGKGRPGPNSKYINEEKKIYDLTVDLDQQAIKDDSLLDGLFLMVTNQDAQKWPPSRLLALYKQEYKVERLYRVMKGPLAVSPMLLEKPHRICSMIFIITLTLQLYTLIQRQAAQELLQRNSPLDGLFPNKIKTWRPQTDKMLAAFDNIHLVQINDESTSALDITTLDSLQLEILQLLGVPENKYSLNAFKIKC
jgi:transposase